MEKFKESDLQLDKVLLKFGAHWCGPCKAVEPVLEKLSSTCSIRSVDTDEEGDLTVKYGIRSVPTYILFEKGKESRRDHGSKTEQELLNFYNGEENV